ncbi:hypothetical protein AVEN_250283-1, partial [Araneus ventricosus]
MCYFSISGANTHTAHPTPKDFPMYVPLRGRLEGGIKGGRGGISRKHARKGQPQESDVHLSSSFSTWPLMSLQG